MTPHRLAAQIAALPHRAETGIWQRYVSARYADRALDGRRTSNARWGTADGFPVLYLGVLPNRLSSRRTGTSLTL